MDIQKILAAVDHALLRPEATWEEIRHALFRFPVQIGGNG